MPWLQVLNVHVPMRAENKHPGFGFVTLSSQAECTAAIGAMNEQKICGRMVAVDVSLNKTSYERHLRDAQQPAAPAAEAAPAEAAGDEEASDAQGDESEEEMLDEGEMQRAVIKVLMLGEV